MKILHLDIETSPNLAHVWGLFKQNVAVNQIKDATDVMCWAAKWHKSKDVIFDKSADKIKHMWSLLDQADAVVHYNGTDFDIPHLNRQFLNEGLKPPSPFKEIDLLKVVRKRFNFPSNKLEYVSRELGIGQKVKHTGFELWIGCMNGDKKSWAMMESYNRQDVVLLEKLYNKILPWCQGHPNVAMYDDIETHGCTNCGSSNLRREGYYYTPSQMYQRWQCKECGSWMRTRFTELPVERRKSVLTGVR